MAVRGWQKGVIKASQWAVKFAREGFEVPVPQGVLNRLAKRMNDPTLRDVQLRAQDNDRLSVSGLKRKAVWVSFSATFTVSAPRAGEPAQSVALDLESAEPFFARGAILSALGELEGVSVNDKRVLVDFGDLIARHKWGKKIPEAVRNKLRITDAHSEQGRLRLRLGLA